VEVQRVRHELQALLLLYGLRQIRYSRAGHRERKRNLGQVIHTESQSSIPVDSLNSEKAFCGDPLPSSISVYATKRSVRRRSHHLHPAIYETTRNKICTLNIQSLIPWDENYTAIVQNPQDFEQRNITLTINILQRYKK
jgi:hypothetical protein